MEFSLTSLSVDTRGTRFPFSDFQASRTYLPKNIQDPVPVQYNTRPQPMNRLNDSKIAGTVILYFVPVPQQYLPLLILRRALIEK